MPVKSGFPTVSTASMTSCEPGHVGYFDEAIVYTYKRFYKHGIKKRKFSTGLRWQPVESIYLSPMAPFDPLSDPSSISQR